jgi:hypothetical protein
MTYSYPIPHDMDASIPSPARMYDYYLGGKDNFPADRQAAFPGACCQIPGA